MSTTTTRERPILFSREMVAALLADKKKQTRRVVKPRHIAYARGSAERDFDSIGSIRPGKSGELNAFLASFPGVSIGQMNCPYGLVGDRLYVRERWYAVEVPGQGIGNAFAVFEDEIIEGIPTPKELRPLRKKPRKFGCKPSIHLPRFASRIKLEITAVRVERLQAIRHRDAIAEGVEYDVSKADGAPLARFQALWNSINGTHAWASNPWVWVIEFKRL